MAINYKREELGGGVALSCVADSKFRSCSVRISFVKKNDKLASLKSALLFDLLSTSNENIPSRTALLEETEGLYGSYVSPATTRMGDYMMAGLSCGFISDRSTLYGETISDKMTDIILDCLFKPQLVEGAFKEEYFRMKQKEALDTIAALVNNKRKYAIREAGKIAFKGEPSMYSDFGTVEDALSVTNADLPEFLKYLMDNCPIEICLSGDESIYRCADVIRKRFEPLTKREGIQMPVYRSFSPLKPETAYVSENADIKQSKMVMVFKSDFEDLYTAKLFNVIYGASPTSMLFENVRENLSLCYYCPSAYGDCKNTLFVDSGVETENIDAAREEILRQLGEAAKGNFSDEEIDNAKRALCDGFSSNYDSPYSMQDWYIAQVTRGTAYSPDEVCKMINSITREQLMECAASFKLDTVYVLRAVSEVNTQ